MPGSSLRTGDSPQMSHHLSRTAADCEIALWSAYIQLTYIFSRSLCPTKQQLL